MAYDVTNEQLKSWVAEVAAMCQPDNIHWCDGSDQEYDQMCELLVKSELGEYRYAKEKMKLDEEFPTNETFECVLGIRPEMVEIETEPSGRDHSIAATVYASQPAGSETLITLTVGNAEFLAIQIGLNEYDINQKVHAVLHPSRMNVYCKATGRLIKFASAKRIKGA